MKEKKTSVLKEICKFLVWAAFAIIMAIPLFLLEMLQRYTQYFISVLVFCFVMYFVWEQFNMISMCCGAAVVMIDISDKLIKKRNGL